MIEKLQRHGGKWFVRRIVRELMKPTTTLGHYFKPMTPVFYHLLSRPINFIQTRRRLKNSSKDTLYFFYDFEVEPITYDFAWALCVANAEREALGLKILKVIFVPGTVDGLRHEPQDYEKIVDRDARLWRIYAILIPCIRLLPCEYGFTVCSTREEAMSIRENQAQFVYPARYNVTFPVPYAPEQAMVYHQQFTSLRATQQAKRYVSDWVLPHTGNKKIVVVTLRQYAYTPERNSTIEAWARFASELDTSVFCIVFVSDTEQAMQDVPEALKSFLFFSPACWSLELRAALYELAYLNLGVNTGPMSLCWFNSQCRYITFKTAIKNVPYIPLKMITDKGFTPGLNPSFAHALQKWVWEDDEFEVIEREFKLMCEALN